MDYKKKLALAKEALDSGSYDKETIEYIFPELKESEDELTWLTKFIEEETYNLSIDIRDNEDRVKLRKLQSSLAWLEKQGEKKEINPTLQEKGRMDDAFTKMMLKPQVDGFDAELNALLKKYEHLPKKELQEPLKFYLGVVSGVFSWCSDDLGIVREEKPKWSEEDDRVRKELMNTINLAYDCGIAITKESRDRCIAWLKKQGEQKTTDKVVPKFKVGDWIVWYNCIYQVLDNNLTYVVKDTKGLESRYEYSTIDKVARYWTIQDVKDGDILASGEVVFIFKTIHGVWLNCHCYAHKDGSFITDSYDLLTCRYFGEVFPATKEQRSFLFQKMKEAGYEWDEDKKELSKIVVPIFNVGDTIAKKHNSDINKFGQFTITDITGGKYWYNDRIICDITKQDEWELA